MVAVHLLLLVTSRPIESVDWSAFPFPKRYDQVDSLNTHGETHVDSLEVNTSLESYCLTVVGGSEWGTRTRRWTSFTEVFGMLPWTPHHSYSELSYFPCQSPIV